MKRIHCEYCGSESLEEHGNVYVCAHCQAKWEKHTVDETMEKLTELLGDVKQEALADARHNLYDAVHEEYLDNVKILMCVQRVQELYPDDFYAKFYEIASGSNSRKINEYLGGIDIDKYGSYIDGVVEYMLKVMERENVMAVSNLIEKAYKDKTTTEYGNIQTRLEKTVDKLGSDIYEVDVPRDVFVAYKSDDMPKVMELVEYLEENGVSCFVALRNLRHGKNAVRIYDTQLEKAMDSCSIVLLVSSHKSRTTGDARYKELPYVRKQDLKRGPVEYTSQSNYAGLPRRYKKPRIEYLIENYKGFASEKFVKEFFDGCTWRKTPDEVYNAIYEIQNEQIIDDENERDILPAESDDKAKYCLACGEKNPEKAKRCMECGGTEFADDYESYLRAKIEKEYADKLKQQQEELDRIKAEKAEVERKAKAAAERALQEKREKQAEAKAQAEALERQKREAEELAARKAKEAAERVRSDDRQHATNLQNYDRQEFDIVDTELKKYNGTAKSVQIPYGVTSISDRAFSGCSSLTSIEIPNSVTSIGDSAFSHCSGLTSIEIPNSVTSIGKYAFPGCSSLTSITVQSGNKVYHSKNNCIIHTADKILVVGCKNSVIPNDGSVTSIGSYAFSCCSGLTSIEIPNSVTSIGSSAFFGCSSLTSITVQSGNKVYHSKNNCIIHTADKILIAGCKDSVIPNDGSVTSIGSSAFFGCSSLTSIDIPNSVTSIGKYAFSGCSGLTSIEIPNSVTSIGDSAFWGCRDLTSIEIPNSVTSIGDSAFSGCRDLTGIEISDSVTSIGDSAFGGCSGLTSIEIPNSVTSIGDYTFFDCRGLTGIEIPNSVTSIGDSAFCGCSNLKTIYCEAKKRPKDWNRDWRGCKAKVIWGYKGK